MKSIVRFTMVLTSFHPVFRSSLYVLADQTLTISEYFSGVKGQFLVTMGSSSHDEGAHIIMALHMLLRRGINNNNTVSTRN